MKFDVGNVVYKMDQKKVKYLKKNVSFVMIKYIEADLNLEINYSSQLVSFPEL